MSRAAMFSLPMGNSPDLYHEYRNAWGGAARIWSCLGRHLGWGAHDWLSRIQQPDDARRFWGLASDGAIPLEDRVAMALTFDHAYVEADDVPVVAALLRKFELAHPADGSVTHLVAWADDMEKMVEQGAKYIGFHHTSVSRNPWVEYPEECVHDPDPAPIYLMPDDGVSIAEVVAEIRQIPSTEGGTTEEG